MATPAILDLATLTEVISGEKRAGTDPRENTSPTSPYYQVKDARNSARARERQIESGSEDPTPPNWKAVLEPAKKLLSEAAKDLEAAAYLVESLTRTQGFAGARDGFRLIEQLVDQFWDDLYPTPDEEGVLTRIAPVSGLNGDDAEGTLLAPLRLIPLTDSANHGGLTYSNYLQALATSKILDPKIKDKKIADGAMTFDKFRSAIDETSKAFVQNLHDDLIECQEAFDAMNAKFQEKCGSDAPPSSAINSVLSAILDAVKDIGRSKIQVASTESIEEAEPNETGAEKSPDQEPDKETDGEKLPRIRNREDALNAVQQLADYFRRVEPQSLVPHALEQAVRWGRMPLADLLSELISDSDARNAFFKQVGIPVSDG